MPEISSVYISGASMSYLVAATYACTSSAKHEFDLYGMYDVRHEVTDASEKTEVFNVVICGAAPSGSAFQGDAEHIGYFSTSKSPAHRLSFLDTEMLSAAAKATSTRSRPKIFLFMTQEDSLQRSESTLRVDFTVLQIGSNRVLPLAIDNMIDSLLGFTKISDVSTRNPSFFNRNRGDRASASSHAPPGLADSLSMIDGQNKVRESLISRICHLQEEIAKKRGK